MKKAPLCGTDWDYIRDWKRLIPILSDGWIEDCRYRDMAIRFILGRSGTGKTSYCVRAIADALAEGSEQPLIFLVPEQATYQAERAILSDDRIAGYHRLHILSFDRLQFLLLGKDAARQRLSRLGRQMLVHEILR